MTMIESIVPTQAPAAGNLLVIGFVSPIAPELLEGWTQLATISSQSLGYYAYSRVATASEPASYEWSFSIAPVGAALYMEITPGNVDNPLVRASSRSL
jgi:hypothetical protein